MSYKDMLRSLVTMDESQLFETMHDLDDWYAVERISRMADKYLNEVAEPESESTEQSEVEEWRQIDNAQRARDIKNP